MNLKNHSISGFLNMWITNLWKYLIYDIIYKIINYEIKKESTEKNRAAKTVKII